MKKQTAVRLQKNRLCVGLFAINLLFFAFAQSGFAWTKSGTAYTTDGSQGDVQSAIKNANGGDTVNLPAGTFVWGTNGTGLSIPTNVTLNGAGTNQTFIHLSSTGPSWANGVIQIGAAATIQNFAINGANSGDVAAFSIGVTNGWRLTGIAFYGGSDQAYFAYVGTYGLIDHCSINGSNATSELIFGRGPVNSWQTPDSLGDTNVVCIENCTFGGQGYVCDANANARFVVRFCTITGQMKVDGHGKASNTPPRGVRQMEIYDNLWTPTTGYFTEMEIRSGTGMVFNNTNSIASYENTGAAWNSLNEYGCLYQYSTFNNIYQTPFNYPVDDQVGVGEDPKVAGSDPLYLWHNIGTGNETQTTLANSGIPAGAIATYTNELRLLNAVFTMANIIAQDRDYFSDQSVSGSFNGTSGVGSGTYSQMLAIIPLKIGVGYWVTDRGYWNTTTTNASGQLYVWNGLAWTLKYTPLTYPYPNTGTGSQPAPALPLEPPTNLKAN